MYEYRDTALIRMPALPPGVLDGPWPDLAGTTPEARQGRHEWMTRTWPVPEIADAVSAASPDLAARLDAILTGERTAGGQEQRAAVSLARYVLRMRHRPTPFGLLAGVAPVRITTSADVSPPGADSGAAAVAGADCAWVADVISGLETVPGLLERLAVRADPTWTTRDGQIIIGCRQHPGAGLDAAPQKVSIRATAMAELALRRARTPVAVTALAAELAAARPGAPQDAPLRLIAGLVGCGALITSLRAPITATDALAHLTSHLAAVSATEIPAAAETARALTSIQDMLGRHAVTPVAERRALRAAAARAMGKLSAACSRPVTTDLRLSRAADLPAAVAREAAAAAGALALLTPDPDGTGPWRAYHARFLDRYGSGAVVPVAELTDPGTGLGLPAGYRGSTQAAPPQEVTSRDQALLALAQQAALDHAAEVSISSDQLTSLAPGGGAAWPPHLDLCFQLRAPALGAAARGQFTLAVISLTPAAGAMTGRFLRLLDPADQDRITAVYAALPTLHPGAVHARVSSPPLLARTENVSRAPATWPRVISLAEHPAGPGPGLDELAVTADERHMYLVSLRDGQQVEPLMLNAVEAAHFTHPVARFLCELPRARAATIGPFPWGPARCLPFLPRIRHGRSILAPATWRISPAALPAPQQPWQAWARALDRHRDHLAIPAAVYADDGDQRLRLDLDQPAHLQLLRASHQPGRPLTLTETPSAADLGWAAGRDHEITLGLALARHAAPAAGSSPARRCPARCGPARFPGDGPYAVATLHGNDQLITAHLTSLLAMWDPEPVWWFTRPDPPGRVRLWIAASLPDAAAKAAPWACQARDLHILASLRWETDQPDAARSGPPPLAAAAEHAAAADSRAAVAALAWASSGGPGQHVITAASLVDIAIAFTGSTSAGLHWITTSLTGHGEATRPARAARDQAVRIACPAGDFAALRAQPGSHDTATAWTRRHAAITTYAARARDAGHSPDTTLTALLHGHAARLNGPGDQDWQAAARLARAAALAATARRPARP